MPSHCMYRTFRFKGKGIHNVVYVATMNDVIYAFDADSNAGSNAAPLWSVSFVNPSLGITPVPATDVDLGGNITGNIGIREHPCYRSGIQHNIFGCSDQRERSAISAFSCARHNFRC